MSAISELRSTFFHLRFNISLTLFPIFLWGFALTEAYANEKFLLGLVVMHFLIYPASNGIYSYFDRKKGVISGIWGIRPAGKLTFFISLFFMLFGIYLSLKVGFEFFVLVLIFFALFFLYAIPSTGIKSRPITGILVVTILYGKIGFLAGWVCGSNFDAIVGMNLIAIGGVFASMFLVAGLFPLAMTYRVSDDSNITRESFVERLGAEKVFKISNILAPIGGLISVIVIASKFSIYELAGAILYFLLMILVFERYQKNFHLQKEIENYRSITGINLTNSLVLSTYLLVRIFLLHLLID